MTRLENARQAVIELARKVRVLNVPELEELVCETGPLTLAFRELDEAEAAENKRKVSLMSGLRILPRWSDEIVEDDLGDFPQTICGFTISRVKVHNTVQRLPTLQGRRLWTPIVILELAGGGSLVFSSDAPPLDVREKLAPTFPHGVRWAVSR